VLAAFIGRPINFTELRNATAAVERLHAQAGFEVVRVLVRARHCSWPKS
jgi:hemolysin activation/secretion protein